MKKGQVRIMKHPGGKRRFAGLIAIMLCVMLIPVGCKKTSSKNGESDGGKKETTSSGSASSSSSGKNKATAAKEDAGDADDKTENKTAADSKSKVRLEYADALKDRARIAGKMAVYFVRGDFPVTNEMFASGFVRGGESTLIVAPDGTTMLVDFSNSVGNATILAKLLSDLGIQRVDYAVLTSPQTEHMGGMSTLTDKVQIGELFMAPWDLTGYQLWDDVKEIAAAKGIRVRSVTAGQTLTLGGTVKVRILSPDAGYTDWKTTAGQREGAVVMRVTYGSSSFLLGGDIGSKTEAALIAKYGAALKSDVVKMNYLGSKDTNTKEWIAAASPKLVVGEGYSVIDNIIMANYSLSANLVLHTALDGTCLVYTSGDGTYEVQVERERKSDDYMELETEKGYIQVR